MYFYFEKKPALYDARVGEALGPTPHLHSHIEMVLLESGRTVAGADLNEVEVNAGDLFIAFPNQVHYYLDKERPVKHKIIIASPDMCSDFGRMFKQKVPKSPLLKNAADNPRIVSAFDSMVYCNKHSDEYSETEARGSMLILMSELFRNIELTENVSCDNDLVKSIINYCYQNYNDGDISLQSIADELGISRCYVSRFFTRRLQIGFNAYINSLRVRSACEMLKTSEMPITEIALAVGYNSVRTFDRCFLNIRQMTPKEYRQKAFEKNRKANGSKLPETGNEKQKKE